MDTNLFKQKLSELIEQCGGIALDDFHVEFDRPQRRNFIPKNQSDYGIDAFKANRKEQPVKILFSVRAIFFEDWHHESGDERRLHPDLKNSANADK